MPLPDCKYYEHATTQIEGVLECTSGAFTNVELSTESKDKLDKHLRKNAESTKHFIQQLPELKK